jgi:hypothetical protein
VSEAEFLRDVDRMQALAARLNELVDALAGLHGKGPPDIRKARTVLALVRFLSPEISSPAGLELLLELIPSKRSKLYDDPFRGMIAASVATLRAADMKNPQIERWLASELKSRALDFTVDNV